MYWMNQWLCSCKSVFEKGSDAHMMNSPIYPSSRMLLWATIAIAIFLGISGTAAAQVGTAAAALNGTVRDASGAVVPGATITLKNSRTGFEQVTKSNQTGNYSLVNISPGTYTATVSMQGFSSAK